MVGRIEVVLPGADKENQMTVCSHCRQEVPRDACAPAPEAVAVRTGTGAHSGWFGAFYECDPERMVHTIQKEMYALVERFDRYPCGLTLHPADARALERTSPYVPTVVGGKISGRFNSMFVTVDRKAVPGVATLSICSGCWKLPPWAWSAHCENGPAQQVPLPSGPDYPGSAS